MDYTKYWTILDSPTNTIKSNTVCLIVAIIGVLIWILTKKFKLDKGDGEKLILLWGTGIFAILSLAFYVLLTFFYVDNSDSQILKILDSPNTLKVKGLVSNFQRKFRNTKYGKETIESFTIDSVEFAYGDAALGKFNSFYKTNNNVIFDGQKVRVTYRQGSHYGNNFNSILKLEIRN
jgi:TM2 domain-containing membrane protein YozV